MLKNIVKKTCMYYGAFSLTCKVLDHISPVPKAVWKLVDRMEENRLRKLRRSYS